MAPYVVERMLNHTFDGVMAVYNHAFYDDERRAALDAWSAWLGKLVSAQAVAHVVQLHPGGRQADSARYICCFSTGADGALSVIVRDCPFRQWLSAVGTGFPPSSAYHSGSGHDCIPAPTAHWPSAVLRQRDPWPARYATGRQSCLCPVNFENIASHYDSH